MPWLFIVFVLAMASPAWAGIPATPVMTLYRFNGPVDFPYYAIDTFLASGPSTPAGTLAQGTSVTPCLVVRNGEPLTDRERIQARLNAVEAFKDHYMAADDLAETLKKVVS